MSKELLLMLSTKLRSLMKEDGQDLVEYALLVALIAFGAVSTISTLAADINTVFSNVGTVLTNTT
jgi:pilus assembly protein Flp/PilA